MQHLSRLWRTCFITPFGQICLLYYNALGQVYKYNNNNIHEWPFFLSLFSIFFFFFEKKITYCLSVVCVNNFCFVNLISNRSIDPKIGLNVGYGVVHVRKAWFSKFELQVANYTLFCKNICVPGFDWSINPILLKIDVHVRFTMLHDWNNRFFKK